MYKLLRWSIKECVYSQRTSKSVVGVAVVVGTETLVDKDQGSG